MNRLDRIMDRVSYKPGWVIDLCVPLDVVELRVACTQPDVLTGLPTTVHTVQQLPLDRFNMMSDDQVYSWIGTALMRLEEHEFDEWFKVDGRHVFDPHPELKAA